MQQVSNKKYQKCLVGISGVMWVAGLLIAGSDSPYMPWVNGIGLILFFCASFALSKLFRSYETDANVILSQGTDQKCHPADAASMKRPGVIRKSYMLNLQPLNRSLARIN